MLWNTPKICISENLISKSRGTSVVDIYPLVATVDQATIKFLKLFWGATRAELLQLKLTPIICMMNFVNKEVGNRKN